jgi:hypothetical protein
MKTKPVSVTVFPWLKANLGKTALGGLTGTDHKALAAAVQIVELWCYCDNPDVAEAFGLIVRQIQEKERRLAYHAIAHVGDWSYREILWNKASMPPVINAGRCEFEPC